MVGEIKDNIKLYSFDGVDLDIENWWSYDTAANQKFSANLASLVKILRTSLDNDPKSKDKSIAIMITVGWNAAGSVNGMPDAGSAYTGTMASFFLDSEAMNAISAVNIMSYNTCIADFYSRHDLVENILNMFNQAGVPKQKIIFGIQVYECGGNPPATSLATITSLGQFIKADNYGGLFLWAIGAQELGQQSSWDYINAMKTGLGSW